MTLVKHSWNIKFYDTEIIKWEYCEQLGCFNLLKFICLEDVFVLRVYSDRGTTMGISNDEWWWMSNELAERNDIIPLKNVRKKKKKDVKQLIH